MLREKAIKGPRILSLYYLSSALLGVSWYGVLLLSPACRGFLLDYQWFGFPPFVYGMFFILSSGGVAYFFRRFFLSPGDMFRRLLYANLIGFAACFLFSWLIVIYALIVGDIAGDDGPILGSMLGLQTLLTHFFMLPITVMAFFIMNAIYLIIPLGYGHLLLMIWAATRSVGHPSDPDELP